MDAKKEEQRELFKEFKEPKKGIERLRERYIPQRHLFVTLSVENLVLVSILIIMTVVLFFSLGVEKGKRIGRAEFTKLEKEVGQLAKKTEKVLIEENTPVIPVMGVEEKSVEKKEATPAKESLAKYTIQVATYKEEATANKEVAFLKKGEYIAFIIPKGNLFQVCVGKYNTLEEAKEDSKRFKSRYKDCYIRSIKE